MKPPPNISTLKFHDGVAQLNRRDGAKLRFSKLRPWHSNDTHKRLHAYRLSREGKVLAQYVDLDELTAQALIYYFYSGDDGCE